MTLDELDRLAAEKVMGWHREEEIVTLYNGIFSGYVPESGNGYVLNWQPTRNIAQALEVFYTVQKTRPSLTLVLKITGANGWRPQGSEATIYDNEILGEGWPIRDATEAPEAIVKACLKAVGASNAL